MKEKNNRNKWLHLRLNQAEYEKIRAQFNATTTRKFSDFVRNKLLGVPLIGSYRNASMDDHFEQLALIKTDLHAASNNFNQAVKKLHTLSGSGQFESWLISYELERRQLLKQVERALAHISEMADKW
jgi:hypothetical protein